jgi:hypothetical protein
VPFIISVTLLLVLPFYPHPSALSLFPFPFPLFLPQHSQTAHTYPINPLSLFLSHPAYPNCSPLHPSPPAHPAYPNCSHPPPSPSWQKSHLLAPYRCVKFEREKKLYFFLSKKLSYIISIAVLENLPPGRTQGYRKELPFPH